MALKPIISNICFNFKRDGKRDGIFHFALKKGKHLFGAIAITLDQQLVVNLKEKLGIKTALAKLFIHVDHSDLDNIGRASLNWAVAGNSLSECLKIFI